MMNGSSGFGSMWNRWRPVGAFSVLVLTLTLAGGCTGQRSIATYHVPENRMIYKTSEITVIRQLADGYASSSSLKMQGVARCRGKHCTPDIIRLMFSVSGNTGGVSFQDRTVRISADGKAYEWEDSMPIQEENVLGRASVAGQITGVRLRPSGLEQIATATSVTGSVGGRSFEVGERGKTELRRLLSAIRNPAAALEDPETELNH